MTAKNLMSSDLDRSSLDNIYSQYRLVVSAEMQRFYSQTEGWIVGKMERWIDGRIDGYINRSIDRSINERIAVY